VNYPESVRFLYSLGNEIKTAKLGLDRMERLMEALDYPHRSFRAVHVAGTNGKGSTSAMIEAGLRAAGMHTGLYTSPHLVEPTERIRIGGEPVSADQFAGAFEAVHAVAERLLAGGQIDFHPTYFETVTAMAFLLFREAGVETAVIEVGLGGRLDATNVILPELTVITPVDFDHEQYLGNTIEAIAGEKAGILKTRVPAVFSRQRAEAEWVLEMRAEQLEIRYTRSADWRLDDIEIDARGSRFSMGGEAIECPLAGEHQVENAVTAAVALRELGVAREGIAQTVWPGRLELVARDPEIILDGAHNPAGARALAAYIHRFYAGRRVWLIYGTMRDKAVDEVAAALFPAATEIIATAPHYSRALNPETLSRVWTDDNLRTAPDLTAALTILHEEARKEDVVFITGSLFLVGEARAMLVRT
jgi:dihydrofolate synthase/folylpolyglutamate synthase